MNKVLNDLTLPIPAKLYYQFPADPIFSLLENVKAVDRFYASFIHRFVAAEKVIDKNETIIDADRFPKILYRLVL